MSPVVDRIIRDIASLSEAEREEVFLALATQKRSEAETVDKTMSAAEREAIDQELRSRVDGPFIPMNTPEERQAFWDGVHKGVNRRLGYDLFEDA